MCAARTGSRQWAPEAFTELEQGPATDMWMVSQKFSHLDRLSAQRIYALKSEICRATLVELPLSIAKTLALPGRLFMLCATSVWPAARARWCRSVAVR
jgi:hypothetical protein